MRINGITMGMTTTDTMDQMISITQYIYQTKEAIERHLELVQSWSF